MTTIQIQLKRARGASKLSQFRLSQRIGISEKTVRRIENDPSYDPRLSTVEAVARALDLCLVLVQAPLVPSPGGTELGGAGGGRSVAHDADGTTK